MRTPMEPGTWKARPPDPVFDLWVHSHRVRRCAWTCELTELANAGLPLHNRRCFPRCDKTSPKRPELFLYPFFFFSVEGDSLGRPSPLTYQHRLRCRASLRSHFPLPNRPSGLAIDLRRWHLVASSPPRPHGAG
jgi:hypothetical protein